MLILGIESSCDETSVAVVKDGVQVLSNVVLSQIDIHAEYGGVVPEIAARSHLEAINPVVDQALVKAGTNWDQIDGIAVTYGAGLSGSLLIGVITARVLAIIKSKPLYAINHVEGHVYANFLLNDASGAQIRSQQPIFPMLALIVSGGHSQLALFRDHFDYQVLGVTRDDAVGEAFDKVAKIIGLPYPGGPSVSKAALDGDLGKHSLPKARLDSKYDFSFSGLKTAVLRTAQKEVGADHTLPSFEIAAKLSVQQANDIAASFQYAAIATLVDKLILACTEFEPASIVIAGGVAANQELRRQITERCTVSVEYAPIDLCTDNGAMIACLGCYQAALGRGPVDPYTLCIEPNLKMRSAV